MIETNLKALNSKIAEVCTKIGRNPDSVTLLAVTKTVPADSVKKAIAFGVHDIGENKVQEAQTKFIEISGEISNISKHFIGHLQTNKAKKAVELFDLIQSVDSLRLAKEINAQAANINKIQDCLIEIKVSGEDTKFGLDPKEIEAFLDGTSDLKNIRFRGIMGMAPYFDNQQNAKPYFRDLKTIFDGLKNKHDGFRILSMGMSGDFEAAIEEGSTMVRLGTAIFGERKYNEQ